MILVPLFYLKFLNEIRRVWYRNFKSAVLASISFRQAIRSQRRIA